MTSDFVLRLSKDRALALSDERTSAYGDKGNVASKMTIKGNNVALLAGSGESTEELTREWSHDLPVGNFTEELKKLTNAFHKIYKIQLDGAIYKPYDLSEEEVLTGTLSSGKPIASDLLKKLASDTEKFARGDPSQFNTPFFRSYILYTGYNEDRDDMEIYDISGAGVPHLSPIRFVTEGSGSSIVNRDLFDFFEKLPAEKRDDIDFSEGLYSAARAFYRSKKNEGVGGVPSIADVGKDYVKKIDSETSRVMINLLAKEREIGTEIVKIYLENLATDKTDASSVAKQVSSPNDLLKYNLS